MREVLRRVGPTSPHRREATSEARTSFGQTCGRVARRFHRGRPRSDPERPARPLSRRRRQRRERARPCERRRRLVQQPGQQPRPQESSLHARLDRQRTVGVSHRRHRVHREHTREFGRWRHVVDHLPEPPFRTRPGLAQHSLLPTLRPGGDRVHSATAGKACQQPPIPAAGRSAPRRRCAVPWAEARCSRELAVQAAVRSVAILRLSTRSDVSARLGTSTRRTQMTPGRSARALAVRHR